MVQRTWVAVNSQHLLTYWFISDYLIDMSLMTMTDWDVALSVNLLQLEWSTHCSLEFASTVCEFYVYCAQRLTMFSSFQTANYQIILLLSAIRSSKYCRYPFPMYIPTSCRPKRSREIAISPTVIRDYQLLYFNAGISLKFETERKWTENIV